MPVYEYECQSCQEVVEMWQSLSEAPATACPSCPGTLKKIISRSSFQLKGGGWYADGYSDKPAAKPAAAKAANSVPAVSKAAGTPAAACPKGKSSCDKC
jgi:putative FmdB family regulatory protein